MSLQFVLGRSGHGKSTYVRDYVTAQAAADRNRDYLMIVPEQFTMQTQMIMAGENPNGGILNIDVLSIGRLTHRIFEEVGKPDKVSLDDLGKCLILRRVISEHEEELTVLKKGVHTPGYTAEIKSILSEFMQYGIRPEDLSEYMQKEVSPVITHKLKDLLLLYRAFTEALSDQYTTVEETLYCLCERIPYSKLLKRSVLVFDGFTGFTPIQVRLIGELLRVSVKVIVTLPYERGAKEDCGNLFYLSEKTIRSLTKEAEAVGAEVEEAVYTDTYHRFEKVPAIAFLEKNLFRDNPSVYPDSVREIHLSRAVDETHECRIMVRHIRDLITEKGYRYRDMAVICPNIGQYSEVLKTEFEKYGIPYFMDATTDLNRNPMVNYLRTLLGVLLYDYAYRDVFGFLRSGMCDFTREEIDLLDNYCLKKGIAGRHMWQREFTEKEEETKVKLNELRQRFLALFEPLEKLSRQKSVTAREWLGAFYEVLHKERIYERLGEMAVYFESVGEIDKALEYDQVYRMIMSLFDQIVSLIGGEEITLEDISRILDTGYGEIRIGIIPKSVDVLPVCDLIRSRFGVIKALFVLGINDGNIPADIGSGGILSDMERQMLKESGMELAPGRDEEGFKEHLYLYQALTKPTEELYLSYLTVSETGDSRKPSYLIRELKELLPNLTETDEIRALGTVNPNDLYATFRSHNILSKKDLLEEFASRIGNYFRYALSEEEIAYIRGLYGVLKAGEETKELADEVIISACTRYIPMTIEKTLASRLYGEVMECSVSSLEKFAGCAYAHFLRYGLNLREREIHKIEPNDIGNITHASLELFGKYLKENGEEFAEVSKEKSIEIIDRINEEICDRYGNGLLGELDQNDYLKKQLKRILHRCVDRLKEQLRSGDYRPAYYEQEFKRLCNEGRTMLKGKIDRIDSYETDDAVYVKIVDYKSGNKDWESVLFDCGVQLQTAVYLSEAVKKYRHDFPDRDVLPGAMFYYRMQDPLLDASKLAGKDLEHERNVLLRPTGLVVEDPEIITHLEREQKAGKSEVIPVTRDAEGMLPKGPKSGNGAARTKEEMESILASADEKVATLSDAISSGVIELSPLVFDKYNACEHCAYSDACGFDERIGGYRHRVPQGGKEAEEE